MSAPAIRTEHLNIMSFKERHITPDYIAWLNDKSLMRFSEQRHKTHTEENCRAYLSSFDGSDNHFLAIEDRSSTLIGTMTVYRDVMNRLADLGIMIGHDSARGHGYGLEAWISVMDWVASTYAPRKITAGCMASNTAMRRIMEHSGMEVDGVRKQHYLLDSRPEDIVYMAKFLTETT